MTAAGALSIHRRGDNGLVDSTQAGSIKQSLDYDDAGALANLSYTYNGTTLLRQSLLRDALGRVSKLVETAFGNTHTFYYRYDLAGRLYGVATGTQPSDTLATYRYDANGNRIAVVTASGTDSATYDGQDRLTSRGVMSSGYTRYTYTAAGELLTKTAGSAALTPYFVRRIVAARVCAWRPRPEREAE